MTLGCVVWMTATMVMTTAMCCVVVSADEAAGKSKSKLMYTGALSRAFTIFITWCDLGVTYKY